MFTVVDVHELLDLVDGLGLDLWLDGGWSVDALLGRQTRDHDDVDVVLQTSDEAAFRGALEAWGFVDVDSADRRACNYVMAHPDGRRVDLHLVTFDENGDGQYDVGGPAYPAVAFTGRGVVDGRPVRCMEARTLVAFHTGYEHDADDVADVTALCEAFDIELPEQYR